MEAPHDKAVRKLQGAQVAVERRREEATAKQVAFQEAVRVEKEVLAEYSVYKGATVQARASHEATCKILDATVFDNLDAIDDDETKSLHAEGQG